MVHAPSQLGQGVCEAPVDHVSGESQERGNLDYRERLLPVHPKAEPDDRAIDGRQRRLGEGRPQPGQVMVRLHNALGHRGRGHVPMRRDGGGLRVLQDTVALLVRQGMQDAEASARNWAIPRQAASKTCCVTSSARALWPWHMRRQ